MGSVLVILFFVSAGVYFIGGIIVLKALRGATGWEMIPNHEFWYKLPSLVKVSSYNASGKTSCFRSRILFFSIRLFAGRRRLHL